MLNDMLLYLLSREVSGVFENSDFDINETINLNYDIPQWMSLSNEYSPLENFIGQCEYSVNLGDKIKAVARNFTEANKDPELSLQILYRDGNIRDFWPKWTASKNL